jgi:hypothetical protein
MTGRQNSDPGVSRLGLELRLADVTLRRVHRESVDREMKFPPFKLACLGEREIVKASNCNARITQEFNLDVSQRHAQGSAKGRTRTASVELPDGWTHL